MVDVYEYIGRSIRKSNEVDADIGKIGDELILPGGFTERVNVHINGVKLVQEEPDKANSFILSHPIAGILGSNKLGTQSTKELQVVYNGENTYYEALVGTDFFNMTESTASIDTTNQIIFIGSGETIISKEVYKSQNDICTAAKIDLSTNNYKLDNITLYLKNSEAGAWEEYTEGFGEYHYFENLGQEVFYKIVSNIDGNFIALDSSLTLLKVQYQTESYQQVFNEYGESELFYNLPEEIQWDISSGITFTETYSTAVQDSSIQDFAFSNDGMHMYIVGLANGKRIYQYALAKAWDITTATYTGKSFNPIEMATASKIHISEDGTKLYLSIAGKTIYQYSLTTPWVISTAVYDLKNITISQASGNINGFYISPDGTKVYCTTDWDIVYYNLSIPWDISTGSFVSEYNSVVIYAGGITFSPDGLNAFITDYVWGACKQFKLSTPWNFGTRSLYTSPDITQNQIRGLAFNSVGGALYVAYSGMIHKAIYTPDIEGNAVISTEIGNNYIKLENPTDYFISTELPIDNTYTSLKIDISQDSDNLKMYFSNDNKATWVELLDGEFVDLNVEADGDNYVKFINITPPTTGRNVFSTNGPALPVIFEGAQPINITPHTTDYYLYKLTFRNR